MGVSAIVPAADLAASNAALEAAGFGPENFSVPLWRGDDPDPDSYGLNAQTYTPEFWQALVALPSASLRDAPPGTVEFNDHVAAEGLKREPTLVPEQGVP